MAILRSINFSRNSEKAIDKILEYLHRNYSNKLQFDFLEKFDYSIKAVQLNPESFPKSEINKNQRKCVVSKQTTVYYKFDNENINVLAVFDTRQNPNKIKKIK
jgi:plasmid stabilization system protein ParE